MNLTQQLRAMEPLDIRVFTNVRPGSMRALASVVGKELTRVFKTRKLTATTVMVCRTE